MSGPRLPGPRCLTTLVNLPLQLFNDRRLVRNHTPPLLMTSDVRIFRERDKTGRKVLRWSKSSTPRFFLGKYRNRTFCLHICKTMYTTWKEHCFRTRSPFYWNGLTLRLLNKVDLLPLRRDKVRIYRKDKLDSSPSLHSPLCYLLFVPKFLLSSLYDVFFSTLLPRYVTSSLCLYFLFPSGVGNLSPDSFLTLNLFSNIL